MQSKSEISKTATKQDKRVVFDQMFWNSAFELPILKGAINFLNRIKNSIYFCLHLVARSTSTSAVTRCYHKI